MRPTGPHPSSDESQLRRDAELILRAALDAVDPERLVLQAIGDSGRLRPTLEALLDTSLHRGAVRARPVRLVSIGKAAVPMARGALRALGPAADVEGIVLAPSGSPAPDPRLPAGLRYREGGHPLPTPDGARATREILSFMRTGGAEDPILALLSGGGSALLSLPAPGVRVDQLATTTDLLIRSGASIQEINTVRKHLEFAKGGRLAQAAAPSPTLTLAISDVIDSPLDVIASGPFSPDPTTFSDALQVLDHYRLRDRVAPAVLGHLESEGGPDGSETPKPGDPALARVRVVVIGDIGIAIDAAAATARSRGYRSHILTTRLSGEARDGGRALAALAGSIRAGRGARPVCVLSGGETTVTVRGTGRGGRNQELALSAVRGLSGQPRILLASLGTDGIDGPTDAAGALVTGETIKRANAIGLDPDAALRNNDSHGFFRALGDLLITGPTGTNVMDLQMLLIG